MSDKVLAGPVRESSHEPLLRVSTRTIAGLAAVLGFILLAMLVAPTRSLIERIDAAWIDFMVDSELSALVDVSWVLAALGTSIVTVPARLLVAAYLAVRKRWISVGYWVLATAGTDLVIGALKGSFGRERPDVALDTARNSAFPSGHSAIAIAIGIAMVVIATQSRDRRRWWFPAAAGFGLLMAVSRTYLRVHWLSDVVAGLVIGAGVSLAAAWVVRSIQVRTTPDIRAARDRIPEPAQERNPRLGSGPLDEDQQ